MGKYTIKNTASGMKTLVYTDLKETRLHSAYDPIKETQRAIDSFNKGRANFILVCGLGLGYHVYFLKKRFSRCRIVVLERDREIVEIVHKTYPEHIENVTIIHTVDDLPDIFENIDMMTFLGVSTFIHRPSYMLYRDFYDLLLIDIKDYLSSKASDLLTRFQFEEKWIENIFKNIHKLFTSIPVCSLFGKFTGYPGVIVSAGPSLKKNVKLLKTLRDRALIVCVDTALKVLQKNNVVPHLVVTIDAQKYSLKHFLGSTDSFSYLLADVVSYPRILEFYQGTSIISTTSKYFTNNEGLLTRETTPLMGWLERFIQPIGDLQSGGSVATTIFDLLLNLNCNSIILVGQDLAYTGREIHCSGTYHNNEWLSETTRFLNLNSINQNVIRKRRIKYVEAFGGNKSIISDFVFDLYRRWFSDSASKVNIPVVNATEGGARIDNTIECNLDEICKDIPKNDLTPGEVLSNAISESRRINNAESLYKGVLSALEDIKMIEVLAEKALAEKKYTDNILIKGINEENIFSVITPFLKKTYTYIARHPDMNHEKKSKLLTEDILDASRKIQKLLVIGKENLEKIF